MSAAVDNTLATAAVVVRRTIAASAEDLFDAWLDPEAMVQWMRPNKVRRTQVRVEPCVGGSYEILMLIDSGNVTHSGVYRVIDRPRRLVFTWISGPTENTGNAGHRGLRAQGQGHRGHRDSRTASRERHAFAQQWLDFEPRAARRTLSARTY